MAHTTDILQPDAHLTEDLDRQRRTFARVAWLHLRSKLLGSLG